MTRGRTPTSPAALIEPDLDQDRIDNAMAVMQQTEADRLLALSQHQAAVRAVALQVGYQLPADCTDPDLIQRDILANMRRSVEACLEVGRGLVVLKEACGHGNFTARLDVLGIVPRVAQRFMAAAAKFSNATSKSLLAAAGNQTKLFELLVLDDDQIEELSLTGQTGNLKIDAVATMSVSELKVALRESIAECEAKDDLLAEKNKTIDAERAKVKRIQAAPADERLDQLRKEITSIANDARGAIIGQLRAGLAALQGHHQDAGGDSDLWAAGVVGQLFKDLTIIRDEFGLPDLAGAEVPEWLES